MTDRDKDGLRGAVHACVEVRVTSASQAEYRFEVATQYAPDGRILAVRHTYPDGSEHLTTRAYDSGGRLVKITFQGADGYSSETDYQYDELGRLSMIGDGGFYSQRFSYDQDGRRTAVVSVEPTPLPPGHTSAGYPWEGSELGVAVPPGGAITTLYDEHDRAVEAHIHNAEGDLVSRVVRRHDAHGRIIEEQHLVERPEHIVPQELATGLNPEQRKALGAWVALQVGFSQVSYTYDSRGLTVEKKVRLGVSHEEVTTFTYNPQGDKITEQVTRLMGADTGTEFGMDARGNMAAVKRSPPSPPAYYEILYAYEYDARGNWIQRTAASRSSPDEEPVISSVTKRRLTYYP